MNENEERDSNNEHSIPVRRPGGYHAPQTQPIPASQNKPTQKHETVASPPQHSSPNQQSKSAQPQSNHHKKHSKVSSIKKSLKKSYFVVIKYLKKTAKFLAPYVKKLLRLLKKLPWKIIIPVFIAALLLIYAVFHLYLASPSRITQSIEANYESSQQLEEDINKTSVFIERIPPFSTDVQEAESALYDLSQSAQSASVGLPPKLFSNYAFRGDEDASAQIDTLYIAANEIDIAELQRTTQQTSELLNLSKQFFEKDIEQDTQGYIILIEDINNELSDTTNNGSELDVSTLQRIFQQVLNSAEQYELNNDIDNFNQQTNNVSSEIYKAIYQSWNDYASSLQANLSTFRSSTESIIFSQD